MRTLGAALPFALSLLACRAPSPAAESSSGSSEVTTESSEGEPDSAGDRSFVPPRDLGATSQCAVIFQDCPRGEKCVPSPLWGDGFFFQAKCVPVTGTQSAGEPCIYDGPDELSDNCDANSGCWDIALVDGEFLGTCYDFCLTEILECPMGTSCLHDFTGYPGYCMPLCNPLLQDCGPGQGCYWSNDSFRCLASSSERALGEPCAATQACAPGLMCLPANYFPSCEGSDCCGAWCELELGDTPCELMPGTVCAPFFPAAPPLGYEGVGVCRVPLP